MTNYVYDEQNTIKEIKRWNDEIIEPDHILKPKETIDGIIRPIIGNKEKGCLLLSPQKTISPSLYVVPGQQENLYREANG